jgi:hypothetical protein
LVICVGTLPDWGDFAINAAEKFSYNFIPVFRVCSINYTLGTFTLYNTSKLYSFANFYILDPFIFSERFSTKAKLNKQISTKLNNSDDIEFNNKKYLSLLKEQEDLNKKIQDLRPAIITEQAKLLSNLPTDLVKDIFEEYKILITKNNQNKFIDWDIVL